MDIVIWTYIFGGATIFASIVGVFSVWNGRITRRELDRVIKETLDQTHRILERQGQMLERQGQMLERMEETQKYIAELVKIEGEKTRSLLTN